LFLTSLPSSLHNISLIACFVDYSSFVKFLLYLFYLVRVEMVKTCYFFFSNIIRTSKARFTCFLLLFRLPFLFSFLPFFYLSYFFAPSSPPPSVATAVIPFLTVLSFLGELFAKNSLINTSCKKCMITLSSLLSFVLTSSFFFTSFYYIFSTL